MSRVQNTTTKQINLPQLASEMGTTSIGGPDPSQWFTNNSKTIWADDVSQATLDNAIAAHNADPTFGVAPADTFTFNGVALLTWTNMPAALTEVPGSRSKIYLGGRSFARMTCHQTVVGASGAILKVQVSTDQLNWVDGPSVAINGTTGLKVSSLVAIPPQYQTDVFVRLAGIGGNGTADPQFGLVTLQVA